MENIPYGFVICRRALNAHIYIFRGIKMKKLIKLLGLCVLALTTPAFAQNVEVFPQMGHREYVRSVVFSPDGRQILSCSGDAIKLWDAATGRELRTFSGHMSLVYCVTFSPDGKYIASGSGDATVKLWDVNTGKEIRTFIALGKYDQYGNNVLSVKFSPDGKQILASTGLLSDLKYVKADKTLKLWNVATGKQIRIIEMPTPAHVPDSVAFSPDGKQILSGSSVDSTIKLWNAAKGKEIRTFTGHKEGIGSVCFSPDGKQVLSGSHDNTMKLWDTATGKEIKTFSGHSDWVNSVALSLDGKYIASGSRDKSVKLWDAASGREIRTLSGHSSGVLSVAFNSDGKKILSGAGDSTVKLWEAASGGEVRTFAGYTGMIGSASFSSDGKQIFFNSGATVKQWDMAAGRETRSFTVGGGYAAFSGDGKQVLSYPHDNNIKLWDAVTGKEIRTFTGHTKVVNSAAFSPDGRQFISGSEDGTIKLWDTATGKEIRSYKQKYYGVKCVAFSPDGKKILSGGPGQITLWNVDSDKAVLNFKGLNIYFITSLAFSPDGKRVLSDAFNLFNYDNDVKLWDVKTGKAIKTFKGHKSAIHAMALSPDGKYIASGSSDNTILLWDTVTGKVAKTLTGHTSAVTSIAFNSDGKQIMSGSLDGAVCLWNAATGSETVKFISFTGSDVQLAAASRGLAVETETAAASVEGEWLTITPDGYYQASPRADRFLNVRVGDTVSGIDSYRSIFYNPDVVLARLQGRPDPASKAKVTMQQIANFTPPVVTIQSPVNFSATNAATADLSVVINDKNQPIKNIKILVNGRLAGHNELSVARGTAGLQAEKASLTVTGSQKTVNITLPLNLDPGNNRIEVVAFNGYSESRSFIDVTRRTQAGQNPSLPNLWILAIGVNSYQDSNIRSLNYCVADAKGVIDSLKAQEGRRYAKVNSLLIADNEAQKPTAATIRQNLKFLDQAGERDVVLLFLAGHGVSDNAGKFLFLPNDTRLNADKSVNEATAISDSDIVSVLDDRAGNLLVFIDACQSGGVDNDRLVRSLMDTNAFVFTSSRGNELSQERKEFGHGVFTYSIMQGLNGATQARVQGNVTVLSLSGFVSLDVPRITGGAQNPKAYSLGFYDFPMALIDAGR